MLYSGDTEEGWELHTEVFSPGPAQPAGQLEQVWPPTQLGPLSPPRQRGQVDWGWLRLHCSQRGRTAGHDQRERGSALWVATRRRPSLTDWHHADAPELLIDQQLSHNNLEQRISIAVDCTVHSNPSAQVPTSSL